MKLAIFNAQTYDKLYFDQQNARFCHQLHYLDFHLDVRTVKLARSCEGVCAFVNDPVGADILTAMSKSAIRYLLLRSAGFNHVDLQAAAERKILVANVPEYSPYAVAEHATALILSLIRKLARSHARVREGNFSLDGLMGYDLHGKTAGIVGTGRIGTVMARIMGGFGCRILACDPDPSEVCRDLGVEYVSLPVLFGDADIISLHCPLTPATLHLIDSAAVAAMKPGVCLINTGRGALIDTRAIIAGIKSGKIGYLGLDVYEEEEGMFFEDCSDRILQDDIFARLLTFPNVEITGHQAFFTHEAMTNIARITLENARQLERTGRCDNLVRPPG